MLDLPCDAPVVLGAVDVDVGVVGLGGVEKGGESRLHSVFVPVGQEKVGAAGQGFLDGKAFGVAGGGCPEAINDSRGHPHGENLAGDAENQYVPIEMRERADPEGSPRRWCRQRFRG